jgi:hypothetical protein
MRWSVLLVVSGLALAAILAPSSARAEPSWLDASSATWNQPGMPIPTAPDGLGTTPPECRWLLRPSDSPEDRALEGAGWTIWGSHVGGWGIQIVRGLAEAYDFQCRPASYQAFVFVDGQLAGTLSPDTMMSRTDGSLGDVRLFGTSSGPQIEAEYSRYTDGDALGFPSARSRAVFSLDRSRARPVLVLEYVDTRPVDDEVTMPVPSPSALAAPRRDR